MGYKSKAIRPPFLHKVLLRLICWLPFIQTDHSESSLEDNQEAPLDCQEMNNPVPMLTVTNIPAHCQIYIQSIQQSITVRLMSYFPYPEPCVRYFF